MDKNEQTIDHIDDRAQHTPARKATIAYEAAQQIDTLMYDERAILTEPWQLKNHFPRSITYKSTYDEIFIIAQEKAFVRPYFEVTPNNVKIPVIFAKINGVSKNEKQYWKQLHSLVLKKNSLIIKKFPFQPFINKDFRFHFETIIETDGSINIEKLINCRVWKYSHLSLSLQKGIAHALKTICEAPSLKRLHHESIEETKVFLFTHAMQIPAEIITRLQLFDFVNEIPTIILYNNGLTGQISRSDAALLLLLNQIGADIIVYNPAGYRDLEKYVNEENFDVHRLEKVALELPWKKPSFLKRLFAGKMFS